MKKENAIEVHNVKKYFKVYFDKGYTLKEKILFANRNRFEERKVLDDISFEIKKGEAVGLIGHNGCGKSTTLKLLTKIIYPNQGTVEMNGRVSSLLELGAGFHPDISGRENIYINASIFGLSKKEIDRRIDNIIEFSELRDFIDNPVRTYSSGMYARLAFSVAINVDADILLIDEILAVGDVNFQAKCFNKLLEIKKQGTTIVLVSHSVDQIEMLCDRSIWIHDGKIKADGRAKEVDQEYLRCMGEQRRERVNKDLSDTTESVIEEVEETQEITQPETEIVQTDIEVTTEEKEELPQVVDNPRVLKRTKTGRYIANRMGTGEARFEKVWPCDASGNESHFFETGQSILFKMKYRVNEPVDKAIFGLSIFRADGLTCYGTNGLCDNIEPFKINRDGEIGLRFDDAMLMPGKYYVDVCIMYQRTDSVDYLDQACEFEVFSTNSDVGVIRMKHEWV